MRINNPQDRLTLTRELGGNHSSSQTIGHKSCVAGFGNRDETSVEISLYVGNPRDVSRKWLASVFTYPFAQLRVARVYARIAASNEKSWRLAERLGGQREGVLRRGSKDGDAFLYSMLVEEYAALMRRLLRIEDEQKFTEAA